MNSIKFFVFLFLLAGIQTLPAQEAALRVFYFKGKADVIHSGNKVEAIKQIGVALKAKEKIKVYDASEIILINASGQSQKLTGAGTWKVDDIVAGFAAASGESVVGAYLSFVWEEFSAGHVDVEKYSREHMRDKGVVTRGCRPPIMLDPAWGSNIADEEIRFTWEKDTVKTYAFVIYDADWEGNELLKVYTTDTCISISSLSLWLRKGQTYYWSVFPSNDPNCARFPFSVMDREARQKFEAEFSVFSQQLVFSDDMNLILKASFFEKYGLLADAEQAYTEAITLAPGNAEYKKMYALFLAREGKTEAAKEMMNLAGQ